MSIIKKIFSGANTEEPPEAEAETTATDEAIDVVITPAIRNQMLINCLKTMQVSLETCKNNINSLDLTVTFDAWETIHTEISQKYDDKVVLWLADKAGMRISRVFSYENKFYKNYILKKRI